MGPSDQPRSRRTLLKACWAAACCTPLPVHRAATVRAGPGGAGGGGAAPAALNVEEIERQVLAARRAIRTAEFEIDLTSDSGPRRFKGRYHTWVADGGRIRQELDRGDEVQVCIRNDVSAFSYTRRGGAFDDPDRTRRPTIRTWPAKEARPDHHPYAAYDPRVLMLVPVPFQLTRGDAPDILVGRPGRENLRARAGLRDGQVVVTVGFDDPRTGNSYEYDVVPGRGHNIVRWRLRGELPEAAGRRVPVELVMTCRLERVADGVWFPEAVELTQTRAGQPYGREALTIRAAAVNQRVEDKRFTLAGGDLPANVAVVPEPPRDAAGEGRGRAGEPGRPPPAPLIWDGREVRPMTRKDVEEIRASGKP